jgi:hypothetical protein
MDPHFAKLDKEMFYRYLDKSNVYFEYGSGGSTYQANVRQNIRKIYTVESDRKWHDAVKKIVVPEKTSFFYNEMNAQPNNWGNPGPDSTPEQRINYSEWIRKTDAKEVDLVLIDGRFRVACCLKCFNAVNANCLIAFDDFLDRPQYHIVLNYFRIVEKTNDNRMVILQKRTDVAFVPDELMRKYELVAN